jgi:lipopolysaccharide export system permease protein
MKIFDFYIFKNVGIATIFVTLCLSAIIFLTQSLRFLELVIEAGASSTSFWILTLLALPRFFEVLVPIAFMGAVLFVYNRMSIDSELVVIRATGKSPLSLAKPVLILSIFMTLFWSS